MYNNKGDDDCIKSKKIQKGKSPTMHCAEVGDVETLKVLLNIDPDMKKVSNVCFQTSLCILLLNFSKPEIE